MNEIILQQIQSMEGVKVVEPISDNQILVTFTPEGNPDPVFISDDNIPVHPGDRYYAVSKQTLRIYKTKCLKDSEFEEKMLSKFSYSKFIKHNNALAYIKITKQKQKS